MGKPEHFLQQWDVGQDSVPAQEPLGASAVGALQA